MKLQNSQNVKVELTVILAIVVALTFLSATGSSNEVFIEGGHFAKYDRTLKAFEIDKDLVTVAEFDKFVKATGYVTDAERYGSSAVFDRELGAFVLLDGATYLFPFGPDNEQAEPNHPATHVSWYDADAFAKWKGKRLPTKVEWEYAASNRGTAESLYAWGNSIRENGQFKANTWQGSFPYVNTGDDGYAYTSPVGAFGRNALGLSDMGGNVWQWCSDDVDAPAHERIFDPSKRKLLKGGSYLCDPSVCHGYKIFGESHSSPETSMGHIGFRCVKDVK